MPDVVGCAPGRGRPVTYAGPAGSGEPHVNEVWVGPYGPGTATMINRWHGCARRNGTAIPARDSGVTDAQLPRSKHPLGPTTNQQGETVA